MAGTVDLLQRCYTGLELRGDELRFNPVLPEELSRLSFRIRYRQHSLTVDLTSATLTIASDPSDVGEIAIVVENHSLILQPGTERSVRLRVRREASR
jgi:trehalose/maltose hydrolase-like predicted phosphorylase